MPPLFRFRTHAFSLLVAAASVLLVFAPASARAQNSELSVNQVVPGGGYQALDDESDPQLSPQFLLSAEGANLLSSNFRLSSGNLSLVRQHGTENSASAIVSGHANLTFQNQHGALNNSEIDMSGNRNRVLVDQRGLRLSSDINVIGAQNQTVVHIQRGRGNPAGAVPIDVSGQNSAKVFVIDTPRGRRVVSQ